MTARSTGVFRRPSRVYYRRRRALLGGAPVTVTLTGAGSLTAEAAREVPTQVTLSGAGSLGGSATAVSPGEATLSGVGSLEATAFRTQPVEASFAGAGSLEAVVGESGEATFSGAGSLTVGEPLQDHTATVDLDGVGSLNVGVWQEHQASANLVGTGSLSVDGDRNHFVTVAFDGAGLLESDGTRVGTRSVSLLGEGLFLADAQRGAPGEALFAGAGSLVADGTQIGPTSGTRTSNPLVLPLGPISGSRISWDATLPSGTTLTIETSVDNGATWQLASNRAPIPRLAPGSSFARTVLTRVTLTRARGSDPTPRLHRLEVHVGVDSTRDELVPLGVFTLNDTAVEDTPRGLEIEISGADLARKVARNRWERTYVLRAGTNFAEGIRRVLVNRMPSLSDFNFVSTNLVTPELFFGEQSSNDPWQDAQDMATAMGAELFFDPLGIPTLRPEPDPDIDSSVWEFNDTSHPTITALTRRITDENTYNFVVVTGEGPLNERPFRGEAIDDDPASPTYYLGPYGTVVDRFTTPMVRSDAQARDAAQARLRRVKGATESVEIEAVPMPAIEPGDVVTVLRGRSKVEGRFLIDSIRMPLGAQEPMRIVGRRQRH